MSNEAGGGGKGLFVTILGLLKIVWELIPAKQKERAIEATVDAFSEVLGHFWEVFKRKTNIGVPPTTAEEASP